MLWDTNRPAARFHLPYMDLRLSSCRCSRYRTRVFPNTPRMSSTATVSRSLTYSRRVSISDSVHTAETLHRSGSEAQEHTN
ncbi:hypothetical protein Q8A73_000219 [Channa argus]|nr:hypothetical protein Q8A73_000219 [Channa argus]